MKKIILILMLMMFVSTAYADYQSIWQLSRGGTGADLSATGGANQVLQQASAGAVITAGQLSLGNLSDVAKNNTANNLLLGTGNGAALTTGTNNTALGYPALSANTSGGWNVAIGSNSLIANTTATDNIAVGDSTLKATTTGYENTAIGSSALKANITGVQNTAIGGYAMYAATGSYLTAVGDSALNACTTCPNSTAVGYAAGTALTTGGANTALGHDALFTDITGSDNTAVGNIALLLETGGTSTAIGSGALSAATTGSANTTLGYEAGISVTTGSNNILIGSGADVSAGAAANRIAIGQGVTNSTDNTASIGNSSITDIHFGNDTAKLHADGSLLTAVTATTNANLTGNVTSVGNATTIAAGVVTEAMQTLADNTTGNVSTTKHGYAPKAPNDATKYLDGTGAYSVPAGGGGSATVSRLYSNTAVAGNGADATEDTLQTYTLPANTLAANGDRVRVTGYCKFSATGNTKTLKVYFGAVLTNLTITGTGSSLFSPIDFMVMKTGSNTQTIDGYDGYSALTGTATKNTQNVSVAGSQTDTSTIVIKLTGQSGSSAANDVVCNQFVIELISH